jgi:hypothetical protein
MPAFDHHSSSIGNTLCANRFPIPIRVIDPSDAADKLRHDRLVKLVEQMLALHQQAAGARTPQEQTALTRQSAPADAQIDRLVYDLYGLTEDEIRIVEGAAA